MKFCLNIWLKNFDKENVNDLWELTDLFDDLSLLGFINDNVHAKYIYLIKEEGNTIGFVYLMPYSNSKIYDVHYGFISNKLNKDYVYTVLTLLRDKVKGYDNSTELKDTTIITSVSKNETKYNKVANTFGNKIYETEEENFYEINPNCEKIEEENKVLKYYLNNQAI